MITKESLQTAQHSVNEAILKIKQSYSNSPSSHQIYFVVEGKDDIPYYGVSANKYISTNWKVSVIPAGNRKKVIDAYKGLNWSIYSKAKILFFIDRDLSDYTHEETPNDSNVYVTIKYAIENELCTEDTYINTLKYYCNLSDIDEADECALSSFYSSRWNEFAPIAETLMAQILCWKLNNTHSNYSNYKLQNVINIEHNILQTTETIQTEEDLLKNLCSQSNVPYSQIDSSYYKNKLNSIHTTDEYIRGKYILVFFAKLLKYTITHSSSILPSKKPAKKTLDIGYEDLILKLCGIMPVPKSLVDFYECANKNLSKILKL